MSGRESIMEALLGLLTAPGVFLTSGRRLVLWTQVQAPNRNCPCRLAAAIAMLSLVKSP